VSSGLLGVSRQRGCGEVADLAPHADGDRAAGVRSGAQLIVEVVKPPGDSGDSHVGCYSEYRADFFGRPVDLAPLQVGDSCRDPYPGHVRCCLDAGPRAKAEDRRVVRRPAPKSSAVVFRRARRRGPGLRRSAGCRLRRSNFRDLWLVALDDAGLSDLHLHDLRHTGNTMAAATGASLRELMERMGHSSSRAAMIYQHASRERDEAIAAAMGSALVGARKKAARPRSGTQRARGRGRLS
jgi:hypothetical protein